jgi:hypothetical protein
MPTDAKEKAADEAVRRILATWELGESLEYALRAAFMAGVEWEERQQDALREERAMIFSEAKT